MAIAQHQNIRKECRQTFPKSFLRTWGEGSASQCSLTREEGQLKNHSPFSHGMHFVSKKKLQLTERDLSGIRPNPPPAQAGHTSNCSDVVSCWGYSTADLPAFNTFEQHRHWKGVTGGSFGFLPLGFLTVVGLVGAFL